MTEKDQFAPKLTTKEKTKLPLSKKEPSISENLAVLFAKCAT